MPPLAEDGWALSCEGQWMRPPLPGPIERENRISMERKEKMVFMFEIEVHGFHQRPAERPRRWSHREERQALAGNGYE